MVNVGTIRGRHLRPRARTVAGPCRPGPAGWATADGSHVHHVIDRSGRRPALLRQHRHAYAADLQRGLPTIGTRQLRSRDPTSRPRTPRTAHRPISTRLSTASRLRSFNHWFALAAPSDLARQARTVWQYRHVPLCQGRLPPSPAFPGSGCPSFVRPLRHPTEVVSHHPSIHTAPRAHSSAAKKVAADFKISFARRSSAFSLFNAFSCSDSSVVTPGRCPHRSQHDGPICAASRPTRYPA